MSTSKFSKALHKEHKQLQRELRDLSRAGLRPLHEALEILRDEAAIPEPVETISRQRRRQMERSAAKGKSHK